MSFIYPWHEQELLIIKNLVSEQRLPRAILLYGPKGVGKANFAQNLAEEIGSGNIAVIQGSEGDSIKIDDIRELIINNSTREFNGLSRVNIICNIEKLTEAAANALLKILEDNTSSYFIFTLSNLSMTKATILSRCFKLNLSIAQASQLVAVKNWLAENNISDQVNQELLLAIANNAPLAARQLFEDNYVSEMKKIEDVIQTINSRNIISCQTKIVNILKAEGGAKPDKSVEKANSHSNKFINMLYYLLNTILINKYSLTKINAANELITSFKRDLERGLALDSENLIFRVLYQLAGDNE